MNPSGQQELALDELALLHDTYPERWFEDYRASVAQEKPNEPAANLHGLMSHDELNDSKSVFQALCAQDWAFSSDETGYFTHDLHPFPAKFIPQIPASLILRLSMPGEVVFDPFGGSATTAVEAVRLRRQAISLDANPICALIGRVKTGFLDAQLCADLEHLGANVEEHILEYERQQIKWLNSLENRFSENQPDIPNIKKWFEKNVIWELCLLNDLMDQSTSGLARDIAQLALSRIVVRVSNQESETRYVSVNKGIGPSRTLRAYLESLRKVIGGMSQAAGDLRSAQATFFVGDSRHDLPRKVGDSSVDLIVSSPPYPNATDYHLYHRFRLFWLGFDPRSLGKIEIGSHLRHQRNDTGFEEYRSDMDHVLEGCFKVLRAGRYAVFVIGDALFKGELFSTCDAMAKSARNMGFDVVGMIQRPLPESKRSFAKAARRARFEHLLVLRKPNEPTNVRLNPPSYRMHSFEQELRALETERILGTSVNRSLANQPVDVQLRQPELSYLQRLTFTKDVEFSRYSERRQPTWQQALEYGDGDSLGRKDPKYVTHGLHPYKGKFYPQLAKSLINIAGAPLGANLFDPYCGSGTTLLEGMLNGNSAFGCDVNPLAARIAYAKTSIVAVRKDIVDLSIRAVLRRASNPDLKFDKSMDQFADETKEELLSWFPEPVLFKLNWLLTQARLPRNDALLAFFEVVVSSLIREVSHQDPNDLRIRRRKEPLHDAPVIEIFRELLKKQHSRLQRYWQIAGRQPSLLNTARVVEGDSRRTETLQALGLGPDTVDCVVTSPPYATALPYIDTDRLSLLAIMGMSARIRSKLERSLTGSREIRKKERLEAETRLLDNDAMEHLPRDTVEFVRDVYKANHEADVGFRRANMAALLWRFFVDIRDNLSQVARVLKPGAKAIYVVGDSRTKAGHAWVRIPTCEYIQQIGGAIGLRHEHTLNIDVSTENYKHIRNAITKNRVIVFGKV